jgi:ribonucleotide reductase alpha subunit
MAILPISHPDILEFIDCKRVEGRITNFNLSVSIPDSFMTAAIQDDPWNLIDPTTKEITSTVSARDLFSEIIRGAHQNGEPGVVFIDRINRDNPVPSLFEIEATNPCVTGDCVISTSRGPYYARNLVHVPFETPDGVKVPCGFFASRTVDALIEITTNHGYEILCTPEHRLQTANGWKEARFLDFFDDIAIVSGTYKTVVSPIDVCRTRRIDDGWISMIVPVIIGPTSEALLEEIDTNVDDVLDGLDTCAFYDAVIFVRELWTMAGRPCDAMVFHSPIIPKIVNSVHLMLLRLGIVCTKDQTQDEVSLHPIDACTNAFASIISPTTGDQAAIAVWESLRIDRRTDTLCRKVEVPGRGEGEFEDVYDATCVPDSKMPVLWTGAFLSHNCSEVPLSPYESCCLGSINLKSHLRLDGSMDWNLLENTTRLGTRFLNDVILANKFVPAVPRLKTTATDTMRIGLGIMGLADMFFGMGLRYGSPESLSVASQVMEFIRYNSMMSSVMLAIDLGPFPLYTHSTFARDEWSPPVQPPFSLGGVRLSPVYIGMPKESIRWDWLRRLASTRGIRNITTTAVAPTGTLSLVAGVNGFGCEPVFAMAHQRRILGLDGTVRHEKMLVPELIHALDSCQELKDDPARKDAIVAEILRTGSCAGIPGIPEHISNVFVCAGDIAVKDHVMMQAVLQHYVDGAISKTINLPPGSGTEDVREAMMMAWKLGCKGICVYVAGSRSLEVLTAGGGTTTLPAAPPPPQSK